VRVATSEIDSFTVGPEGLLTPAPESPLAAQGPGPFGSEFSPVNPTQLFVSNAHGGAEAGSVSAFSVAPNGALSSIGSSPFKDSQTAPCWVEISHDGRYLFAVNTVSGSISRYAIAWNGSLELLGSTLLKASTGKPEDARLDPDGDTLWVLEAGGLEVAGLAVHNGALSELASSPAPLPAGAAPFGIVVT
jgi:6-phosphogluconolactonase (cycloisomerase 2 family)